MAHKLTDITGKELMSNPDLSEIRPGHLALMLEKFMDNAHVPLHTRVGAVFQLAANYLTLALKPKEKGDDA